MPLAATASEPSVRSERSHQGLVFDMRDEGKNQLIRILVTAEALHGQLDRNARPRDRYAGREIFDQYRGRIEAAASKKYDAKGADDELDGHALLIVQSMDL
jgi:hypothetical protein